MFTCYNLFLKNYLELMSWIKPSPIQLDFFGLFELAKIWPDFNSIHVHFGFYLVNQVTTQIATPI